MSEDKYCSMCGAKLIHTTKPNNDAPRYDRETGRKLKTQVYNYWRCPNVGLFNTITGAHDVYNDEPDNWALGA